MPAVCWPGAAAGACGRGMFVRALLSTWGGVRFRATQRLQDRAARGGTDGRMATLPQGPMHSRQVSRMERVPGAYDGVLLQGSC